MTHMNDTHSTHDARGGVDDDCYDDDGADDDDGAGDDCYDDYDANNNYK